MKELHYQQKAVRELVDKTVDLLGLDGTRHMLVFKAPTGSGKTVMASEMLMRLKEELQERPDAPVTEVAYVWIAPNRLHEQSYFKMKNYFTESRALSPVVFDELDHSNEGYIRPGEILFVNWESINKDKNVMIRDTELNASLYDITRRTQEEQGIPIVVIIDEEHQFGGKNAKQSEKVLKNIDPKVEIRISATPNPHNCEMVVVPRQKVIEEEMIKRSVVLNPALNFTNPHGSLNQHLIWLAMQKREELAQAYRDLGVNINPLLLIQLPNDDKENMTPDDTKVRDEVITTLEAYGLRTDNNRLAVWLSNEKTNLDNIEEPDNPTEVLLFKQAIALGWDCPRAAVLLIFRKVESFQFSAQTVGRILRMPEQHYYTDDRLNHGYVYTNLSKDIIEIVKDDMNYLGEVEVARRRDDVVNVALTSEYSTRLSADRNRLGSDFVNHLRNTFKKSWGVTDDHANLFSPEMLCMTDEEIEATQSDPVDVQNEAYTNKKQAIAKVNITFEVKTISTDIVRDLDMTGEVGTRIVNSKAKYINNMADLQAAYLAFCKKMLGNDFEQKSIRTLAGDLTQVMEELFEVDEFHSILIILSNDNQHHNRLKFETVLKKAIESYKEILARRQLQAKNRAFTKYTWEVPIERAYPIATHDEKPAVKDHALLPFYQLKKASAPEVRFADFLERNADYIQWWYKNGDGGKQNYAISYTNTKGVKSLFYVDFILRMANGDVMLFDTKSCGSDEDAVPKHNALIDYINAPENADKHLHGGIIIEDDEDMWRYCPVHISSTDTLDGWDVFHPDEYRVKE